MARRTSILIAAALLVIASLLLASCTPTEPPGEVLCASDTDCILAIDITKCCECPFPALKSKIASDDSLREYIPGKDYASLLPEICRSPNIGVCAPCPPLQTVACRSGVCFYKEEPPVAEQPPAKGTCAANADCVLAIDISGCCPCPFPATREVIATDSTLREYVRGQNYRSLLPEDCDMVDCAPCPPIEDILVCQGETCMPP